MVEFTIPLLSSLVATGYPIAMSLIKETKFVSKNNLYGYAVASFVFALSWTFDLTNHEDLQLKYLALGIFLSFSAISGLMGWKVEKNHEGPETLPLAGRQVGAFQTAFLLINFMGVPQKLFISLQIPSVIDYAILFLTVYNLISLSVYLMRKRK